MAVLQVPSKIDLTRENGEDAVGVLVDIFHEGCHQWKVLLDSLWYNQRVCSEYAVVMNLESLLFSAWCCIEQKTFLLKSFHIHPSSQQMARLSIQLVCN